MFLCPFFSCCMFKTTRRHSRACPAGRAHPCLDPFIHTRHAWLKNPTLFSTSTFPTQPSEPKPQPEKSRDPNTHANPTNKKQKLDTPLHTTSPSMPTMRGRPLPAKIKALVHDGTQDLTGHVSEKILRTALAGALRRAGLEVQEGSRFPSLRATASSGTTASTSSCTKAARLVELKRLRASLYKSPARARAQEQVSGFLLQVLCARHSWPWSRAQVQAYKTRC